MELTSLKYTNYLLERGRRQTEERISCPYHRTFNLSIFSRTRTTATRSGRINIRLINRITGCGNKLTLSFGHLEFGTLNQRWALHLIRRLDRYL